MVDLRRMYLTNPGYHLAVDMARKRLEHALAEIGSDWQNEHDRGYYNGMAAALLYVEEAFGLASEYDESDTDHRFA